MTQSTSMLQYTTDSIFDTGAQCLVNPVNTVGVMGAGLALSFKHRYPDMFSTYKVHCAAGTLRVGSLMFYKHIIDAPIICLFPTKRHWKESSQLIYIESGLQSFVKYYTEWKITSVAFPKLGCGLGGLNWTHEVEPLFVTYLSKLPIDVYVCV